MNERVFRPKIRDWREYDQRRDERVQILDTGKIYTALLRVSGRSWEALECAATVQSIEWLESGVMATVSVLHQDDFVPLTKTRGVVTSSLWRPPAKELNFYSETKGDHYATEGYFLEYDDGMEIDGLIDQEVFSAR